MHLTIFPIRLTTLSDKSPSVVNTTPTREEYKLSATELYISSPVIAPTCASTWERILSMNIQEEHSVTPTSRRKLATFEVAFNNPIEMERRKIFLQSYLSELISEQLVLYFKISSQRDFIFSRAMASISNREVEAALANVSKTQHML